jgi:hypothetical protein
MSPLFTRRQQALPRFHALTRDKASRARGEALTSTITRALESAHEIIKAETGAPRATLLVTRDLKGRKGHFTPFTPWQNGGESFNEIAFNLEHFTTPEELLSTFFMRWRTQ